MTISAIWNPCLAIMALVMAVFAGGGEMMSTKEPAAAEEDQIEQSLERNPTAPVVFFPEDALYVRFFETSRGISLISVSEIIDVPPPAVNPDVEFDLNQVAGVTRTTYESDLYLVNEGMVKPLAHLTISRRWQSGRGGHEKAYNVDQGSRLLDAYFDGNRLVMLYSFCDSALCLSVGSIDIASERVTDYSKTILLDLGETESQSFPGVSDVIVNESGEAFVRIRIAPVAEGGEPATLATIPVAANGAEGQQEILSVEEFKRRQQSRRNSQ